MRVLLISTYELGRQPFGLASPAAWLREAGHSVTCRDLSQERLSRPRVAEAELIAFYLPMHTATRIALRVLERVREWNPAAHVCAYGLYAPVNAELLRARGVSTILGGEFEAGLVELAERLSMGQAPPVLVDLAKLSFRVPYRNDLPPLEKYARLKVDGGRRRVVGYTEASRGCRHLCRHCPVVPIYGGAFRVVQKDAVLQDIRQQVAMGAGHITFGDPDFFNGPGHAMAVVSGLHREFPELSYDVTIKVEHLLRHAELLPQLRDTGCAFVTSAIESVDDRVLALLEKGHTRADFIQLAGLMRVAGLPLSPTFIPFHPWATLESYAELLRLIAELEMTEQVAPVQLSIRLLVPQGSRLLELGEVRGRIGAFAPELLSYPWHNEDPRVDELQRQVEAEVEDGALNGRSRSEIFARVWELARRAQAGANRNLPELPPLVARAAIPYLTEPWYC